MDLLRVSVLPRRWLLLSYNGAVILDTEVRLKNGSYYDRTQFIICDLCFWCASSISGENLILTCPLCLDNKIRRLPISYGEIHKLHHNPQSGVHQEIDIIAESEDIKDLKEDSFYKWPSLYFTLQTCHIFTAEIRDIVLLLYTLR